MNDFSERGPSLSTAAAVMTVDPLHHTQSPAVIEPPAVPTNTPLSESAALAASVIPVMSDGNAMTARYAAILRQLPVSTTDAERAVLKQDIIALFRDVSEAADQFAQFKDAVKALASEWKTRESGGAVKPSAPIAPFRATPPVAAAPQAQARTHTQRVDHLGASTFVEKGWSKLSLGDPVGAEVALRRALEFAPNDNEAECLLGWAQMHQQQYDSALATFHNVLSRDAEHALARTNLGFVCLRKGIYGEAIEHLSRAIRANTDRKATLYAHLYLGMVYREREMFDDAQLFFGRALELGPNLLEAWYESGRAFWFAGKVDEARAAWRQGADANKFNPWGKRCAEMLVQVDQGGAPPRHE